jgi:terminase, large subunit
MNQSLQVERDIFNDSLDFISEEFCKLTDEMPTILPSEWAESKRYLSATVSTLPGLYSYEVTPYLKEIVDCLAPSSSIRFLDFLKAAQIGATVGVIENFLGYSIEHTKTVPILMVTSDSSMAKLRVEQFILPMLQDSNMMDLIQSSDVDNKRKTGRTARRIEWKGGGWVLPVGANNPAAFRSIPFPVLLFDEPDSYKDNIGKDGDPIALAETRSNTFVNSRKICAMSTPLLMGSSKIHQRYLLGDQRKFYVPCPKCKEKQVLRWSGVNNQTGEVFGMYWELDEDGLLNRESVRYICKYCGFHMKNEDKTFMLANGEWRATAKPVSKERRSYQLSALYSPVVMFPWESCVDAWLEAWDVERKKPKSIEKLQVFYNNILGEPFEQMSQSVSFNVVSGHRRRENFMGVVPNAHAEKFGGSVIQILTCAVDVQKDYLSVCVFGWTVNKVPYIIDYFELRSNGGLCDDIHDPDTWGALETFIETKEYKDGEGRIYPVTFTLIDSGHETDAVYEFCYRFADQHRLVFPLKGDAEMPKGASHKEFTPFKTKTGMLAYHIRVDFYKDRWGRALRYSWDGISTFKSWHLNAPTDMTDKQLKELTREKKFEVFNSATGRSMGFRWKKTHDGARNELWDLTCYNTAALEIFALQLCAEGNFEVLNWDYFFSRTQTGMFYIEEK